MESKRVGGVIRLLVSLMVLCLTVWGTAGRVSAASIIFVNRNVAGGLNNGTSWPNAYKSLQTAVASAASGQQIWVAKGTYKPTSTTDRTKTFALKSGVAVYGGFAGTETLLTQRKPTLNVTILSGEIGAAGVSDNSYHVVMATSTNSTAILDGFTITAGNASGGFLNDRGGGMYNDQSSPTLRNLTLSANRGKMAAGMYNYGGTPTLTGVIFSANHAVSGDGGGMYDDGSNPKLTHVTFSNNTASNYGGGIYSGGNPTLTDVTLSGNSAAYGGGMYNDANPTTLRVSFINNKASVEGGGMYNNSTTATISNVVFNGNSAQAGAGLFNNIGGATVSNATFSGNKASSQGGALFNGGSPSLINVTLSGNSAAGSGGGMYNFNGSPTIINATLAGNSANSGGAMYDEQSAPVVSDSIFWGNGSEEIHNLLSAPVLFNSIIKGGCPTGSVCNGVFNLNPQLGPLQNNGGPTKTMALGAGSAAIDRGDSNCALKDQRGVKRPQGLKCDIGAYEVRALTLVSAAGYDGLVLESGENSSVGGLAVSNGTMLRVGDDSSNRQYRDVLSFTTGSLPDAATVVAAKVRVKQESVVGTNPFTTHGKLLVDLAKPYFGAGIGLLISDFQAAATVSAGGSISPTLSGGWYTGLLAGTGLAQVNKTGTTQFRLRFKLDDNNDNSGDYVSLWSGDAAISTDRPRLIVYYNP